MGPYCKFCDHRCFVVRDLPGPRVGSQFDVLMATCEGGKKADRERFGLDHTGALNRADSGPRYSQSVTSGFGGGCYS